MAAVPVPMPNPRSVEAPLFRGKRIKPFLEDFERLAVAAGLDDARKCTTVARYCKGEALEFVESLQEYEDKDWDALKSRLLDAYPSEADQKRYSIADLRRLSNEERSISNIMEFEAYNRRFQVILRFLAKKKMVADWERDDLYFQGVYPKELRARIADVLKASKDWKDLHAPPPMSKVEAAMKAHLKSNLYAIDAEEGLGTVGDDQSNESSDAESEQEEVLTRTVRKETKVVKKDGASKLKVESENKRDATEDLAERLHKLSLLVENQKLSTPSRVLRSCYMCGEQSSHIMHDCPKTAELMASGAIKIAQGRIVRADGSQLPKGTLGQGGIAKALTDELNSRAARVSGVQVSSNVLQVSEYEFAMLDTENISYYAMPAERSGSKAPSSHPYDRHNTRSKGKLKPEPEVVPKPKPKISKTPRILKRTVVEEDAQMEEVKDDEPKEVPPPMKVVEKPKPAAPEVTQEKEVPKPTQAPKRVTFDEDPRRSFVDLNNPNISKPKRASPSFKFSSEVQETVDFDELTTKILDSPLSLTLREALTSYEIAKRVQTLTKLQKIPLPKSAGPIAQIAALGVEGKTNQDEPREIVKESSEVKGKEKESELTTANEENNSEDISDLDLDATPRPKPKELAASASVSPKTEQEKKNEERLEWEANLKKDVEVWLKKVEGRSTWRTGCGTALVNESDDDSDSAESEDTVDSEESSDSDGSDSDASEYYIRRMLENEYEEERRLMHHSRNVQSLPTTSWTLDGPRRYLAMVSAKIYGLIDNLKVLMLLDNGSDLNLITKRLMENLSLPMDPDGSFWSLKGISGAPVPLVGLCRDVEVVIGGIAFKHNFFVTEDSLGDKDLILGQPWLIDHAARFDYLPQAGVALQVWQHGNRKEGRSILMNIRLIQNARNVMSARVYSREPCWISSMAECSPPGREEKIVEIDVESVPSALSSLTCAFEVPESSDKKYGPVDTTIDFVNRFATLEEEVLYALRRTWLLKEPDAHSNLLARIWTIGEAKGYEPHEAKDFAESLTWMIMGAKYKPVAKKVLPVSTWDPESDVPQYKPIEVPQLGPLSPHPLPLEMLKFSERLTEERIGIILEHVPKGFLTKEEMELLLSIVFEFENTIAFTDAERGTFSSVYFPEYKIRTVPHEPWQKRPMRLPDSKKAQIMEMLEEQKKAGKYEPSTSSYRSTFFAVEKKTGKLRIVHDLQPLNAVTIRDAGLPPRVDEIIEEFKGHAIYAIADLKAGYDGVPLAKESRPLTAFHAYDLVLMQLTSLPVGFTNAMAEFCRRSNHMLKAEPNASAFVDDCMSRGPKSRYNEEAIEENPMIRRFVFEHAEIFRRMLALMSEAGVTVAGEKLVLATPALEMIGTVVSIDGALISRPVAAKIANWPDCTNQTQVRGFLGVMGVIRRWIEGFATIAKPLTMLTRKLPGEFEWTEEAREAMRKLKEAAMRAPPLIAIDYQKASSVGSKTERETDEGLVTLAVDASWIGAGWILSQINEGVDSPVLFGSVTFQEHETRYSQPKLELYGVFRAVKAERHRLYGITFRLKVDAQCLLFMLNSPDIPNAAVNRWISFIHLFQYEIEHVPATKHRGPDGLSRRPHAIEDASDSGSDADPEEGMMYVSVPKALANVEEAAGNDGEGGDATVDEEQTEQVWSGPAQNIGSLSYKGPEDGMSEVCARTGLTENEVLYALNVVANGGVEKASSRHQFQTPENDSRDYWDEILAYLAAGKLPQDKRKAHAVKIRATNYFLYNEQLWRRREEGSPPQQVVLEASRRLRILVQAHDMSGHRGIEPTYRKIIDSFWWPNIHRAVVEFCQSCHECQIRSKYKPKVPIQITYTRTILREFTMDCVYMGPGVGGALWIVDMRDKMSGFLEARAIPYPNSDEVASFVFDNICRYGCIPSITTDNGSEFKAAFAALADKFKIRVVHTSAHNPGANGIVERGHGTYVEGIWKCTEGKPHQWPHHLQAAIWADRVTAKRTTGCSPYYLMYGQMPLFPYDVLDRSWHTLDWPNIQSTEDLLVCRMKQLSRRDEFIGEVDKKLQNERAKAAMYFYEKNAARIVAGDAYQPGTVVLVSNDASRNHKSEARWLGPFVVVQKTPKNAYILGELDGTVLRTPFAAGRLKWYYFRGHPDPIILLKWQKKGTAKYDVMKEHEWDGDKMIGALKAASHAEEKQSRTPLDAPRRIRPWELPLDEQNEYWKDVAEDVRSGRMRERAEKGLPSKHEQELEEWQAEDQQFWDYRWDFKDYDAESMPRFKEPLKEQPRLFEWKKGNQWNPIDMRFQYAEAEAGPQLASEEVEFGKLEEDAEVIVLNPADAPSVSRDFEVETSYQADVVLDFDLDPLAVTTAQELPGRLRDTTFYCRVSDMDRTPKRHRHPSSHAHSHRSPSLDNQDALGESDWEISYGREYEGEGSRHDTNARSRETPNRTSHASHSRKGKEKMEEVVTERKDDRESMQKQHERIQEQVRAALRRGQASVQDKPGTASRSQGDVAKLKFEKKKAVIPTEPRAERDRKGGQFTNRIESSNMHRTETRTHSPPATNEDDTRKVKKARTLNAPHETTPSSSSISSSSRSTPAALDGDTQTDAQVPGMQAASADPARLEVLESKVEELLKVAASFEGTAKQGVRKGRETLERLSLATEGLVVKTVDVNFEFRGAVDKINKELHLLSGSAAQLREAIEDTKMAITHFSAEDYKNGQAYRALKVILAGIGREWRAEFKPHDVNRFWDLVGHLEQHMIQVDTVCKVQYQHRDVDLMESGSTLKKEAIAKDGGIIDEARGKVLVERVKESSGKRTKTGAKQPKLQLKDTHLDSPVAGPSTEASTSYSYHSFSPQSSYQHVPTGPSHYFQQPMDYEYQPYQASYPPIPGAFRGSGYQRGGPRGRGGRARY